MCVLLLLCVCLFVCVCLLAYLVLALLERSDSTPQRTRRSFMPFHLRSHSHQKSKKHVSVATSRTKFQHLQTNKYNTIHNHRSCRSVSCANKQCPSPMSQCDGRPTAVCTANRPVTTNAMPQISAHHHFAAKVPNLNKQSFQSIMVILFNTLLHGSRRSPKLRKFTKNHSGQCPVTPQRRGDPTILFPSRFL